MMILVRSFEKHKNTKKLPIHFVLKLMLFLLVSNSITAQKPLKNNNFFEEIGYEIVNGKIIIPVTIQNQTFRFFFDTGGLLVISPNLKEKLGLRSIDSGTVSGVNNVKTKIDVVKINNLKIASLEFNNRKAIVSSVMGKHPVTCFEVDGIIGRDLINNMALQLNHQERKIILTDQPHRLKLDKVKARKMQFAKNRTPVLPIKINGKNIKKVIFDSGADDFISLKTKNISKYKNKKVYMKDDIVSLYGNFSLGISGSYPAPEKQYHIFINEFEIAGIKFNAFYSDISKKSNNRIGTEILKHGVLTLDYINKKFYFEAYKERSEIKRIHSFGFSLRINDQNAIISGIFENSPAADTGMEVGHKILSINDLLLSQLTDQERCDFLLNSYPWKDSNSIEVKFLNKLGQVKVVRLERFEL